MARTPDVSGDGQKRVRDAIKRGGPMPFVTPKLGRGDSAQPVQGNPLKQRRMRPVKADPEVLQRVLDGARSRK